MNQSVTNMDSTSFSVLISQLDQTNDTLNYFALSTMKNTAMHPQPRKHLRQAVRTAAFVAIVSTLPIAAMACPAEPFVGAVCTMAANYCPQGFAVADGSLLQIMQNQALYAVLGVAYGGDAKTTFALPDLRGRVVVGTGTGKTQTTGANLTPVVLGAQRGVEAVTLNSTQTPVAAHTHPATFTGTGGSSAPATANGSPSLTLTGTVSNAPVTGTVTANVITAQTTGAQNLASNTNNTVGKNGGAVQFYPYSGATAVASPTTISLNANGGTLSGTATGVVSLPVTGGPGITGGTVSVAANAPAPVTQPVPLLNPGLGLTVCIATTGIWPTRP